MISRNFPPSFLSYTSDMQLKGSKVVHGRLLYCFWAFLDFIIFRNYLSPQVSFQVPKFCKQAHGIGNVEELSFLISRFESQNLLISNRNIQVYHQMMLCYSFHRFVLFSFLQLVKVIRGFIDVCSTSTSQLNYWKYETHQYPPTLLVFPVLFNFHLLGAFNSDLVILSMMRLNRLWLLGNVVGFYVFMIVVTAIIAITELNCICCLKWFGVEGQNNS